MALWVLDPAHDPKTAIARALTEQFFEMKRLGPEARERQGNITMEKILQFARNNEWEIRKNRKGETTGILEPRPDTKRLLELVATGKTGGPFRPLISAFQQRANAAVHGNSLSWMELVAATGVPSLQGMILRTTVAHLMYALDLHMRAMDAWNASIEWTPQDLLEESKIASFAGVMLPYVRLAKEMEEMRAKDSPDK